jgi:hypothetical protein
MAMSFLGARGGTSWFEYEMFPQPFVLKALFPAGGMALFWKW